MSAMYAKAASACSLAQTHYYLSAQYHRVAILPWEKLSPLEQHERVEAANVYLATHPPTRGVTYGPDYFGSSEAQARRTTAKVLAFIENDAPLGGAA